jgi:hypothetical protein
MSDKTEPQQPRITLRRCRIAATKIVSDGELLTLSPVEIANRFSVHKGLGFMLRLLAANKGTYIGISRNTTLDVRQGIVLRLPEGSRDDIRALNRKSPGWSDRIVELWRIEEREYAFLAAEGRGGPGEPLMPPEEMTRGFEEREFRERPRA